MDKHCKQSKLNMHNIIFMTRKKGEETETWCVSLMYIPVLFLLRRDERERNFKFVFEICGTLLYNMNKLSHALGLLKRAQFLPSTTKKMSLRYLGERAYTQFNFIVHNHRWAAYVCCSYE